MPGFRPKKVPKRLVERQSLSGGTVVPSVVDRVDAAWVHGRGQDARAPRLRQATVAILGCGSIGAAVAIQLAQAGVGTLLLVDPELLEAANTNRHPLGAASVGQFKAKSLADKIRADFPHIVDVQAVCSRWEAVDIPGLDRLASCDLMVSAIGDWGAESALNAWHLRNRRGPIVYGWTEAHACAGHAVAILQPGACLQCGFTPAGDSLMKVTDWPGGSTVRQEPACGAVYQPYGPVELSHITSIVTETSLDCLLGQVRSSMVRTWVARKTLLEVAGGSWSPEWLSACGHRVDGGFTHDRAWLSLTECIECKGAVA